MRTTAVSTEPSEREELYLAFWTEWLERVKEHGWTSRKAPAKHFVYIPSGVTATRHVVSFRTGGILSELFFNHEDRAVNVARWKLLERKRATIEAAFGGPLSFEELPTRKGCRIGIHRTNGESIEDAASWEDYFSWFADTQVRPRHAIGAVGGIPPVPADAGVEDDPADDDLAG